MNNTISYQQAIEAALEQAGLKPQDARIFSVELDNELYYIRFRTDWQRYECYLDSQSGNLLGLSFEPSVDIEQESGENLLLAAQYEKGRMAA